MDVILDVDPGVDDALAILLALASPELNIRAVTVVCGNVPLHTGTDNAFRILQFAGREDIPVYSGAEKPLIRDPVHAKEVHGATGLGAAHLPPAERGSEPGASEQIATRLTNEPGQITLIAVGPLTNLALAERDRPGVLSQAKAVIVMGGAVLEPGNSAPTAEFNFFVDPHAAHDVIHACGDRLTLVPLDVTHQVGIEAGEIDALRPVDGDAVDFFCKSTELVVDQGRKTGGYAGVYLHDPTAVAYAIEPDLFDVETFRVDVETGGDLTAGQVVVDRRRIAGEKLRGVEVHATMGVRQEEVLQLFRERVLMR